MDDEPGRARLLHFERAIVVIDAKIFGVEQLIHEEAGPMQVHQFYNSIYPHIVSIGKIVQNLQPEVSSAKYMHQLNATITELSKHLTAIEHSNLSDSPPNTERMHQLNATLTALSKQVGTTEQFDNAVPENG